MANGLGKIRCGWDEEDLYDFEGRGAWVTSLSAFIFSACAGCWDVCYFTVIHSAAREERRLSLVCTRSASPSRAADRRGPGNVNKRSRSLVRGYKILSSRVGQRF